MTDFRDEPERRPGESIVPMINIVFLLLVFFLITATLAPPDPFEVALPGSAGVAADPEPAALYVSRDGRLAYRTARGAAVFAAIAAELGPRESLALRADADTPGPEIARLLARLSEVGVARVEVIAVAR